MLTRRQQQAYAAASIRSATIGVGDGNNHALRLPPLDYQQMLATAAVGMLSATPGANAVPAADTALASPSGSAQAVAQASWLAGASCVNGLLQRPVGADAAAAQVQDRVSRGGQPHAARRSRAALWRNQAGNPISKQFWRKIGQRRHDDLIGRQARRPPTISACATVPVVHSATGGSAGITDGIPRFRFEEPDAEGTPTVPPGTDATTPEPDRGGFDMTGTRRADKSTAQVVSESDIGHLHLNSNMDEVMSQAQGMWSEVSVIGAFSDIYLNIFLDDVRVTGSACAHTLGEVCSVDKEGVDKFFRLAVSSSPLLRAAFGRSPGPMTVDITDDVTQIARQLADTGSLIRFDEHGVTLSLTSRAVMFVRDDSTGKERSARYYPPGLQLLDAAMGYRLYGTADAEVVRMLTDSVWGEITNEPGFSRISHVAVEETDCERRNEVLAFYNVLEQRSATLSHKHPPVSPVSARHV
ncbi:hypothetical protein [Burkholderia ambifaria]|uniref:hypothetical protein n=1 Tax=Burkholderia ambifaria TaxID=152480 RepID=UPI001590778E|nr:hypothetical protein [Burkholderia ambifaria]